MLAGEIYSAVDPQLIEELTEVKEIIHDRRADGSEGDNP